MEGATPGFDNTSNGNTIRDKKILLQNIMKYYPGLRFSWFCNRSPARMLDNQNGTIKTNRKWTDFWQKHYFPTNKTINIMENQLLIKGFTKTEMLHLHIFPTLFNDLWVLDAFMLYHKIVNSSTKINKKWINFWTTNKRDGHFYT